jgi:glycosyltransferase involved in cell wall biosynthesis
LIHYFLINFYFKLKKIDIVLNLGALPYFKSLVPFIVVSQNMLPFERSQISLFGMFSFMGLKLLILRFTQKLSFTKASGVIFLSQYAKKNISKILSLKRSCRVIPHGVEPRFNLTKRDYNKVKVLTYVSPFYPYKHQEELIKAFLMSKIFIGSELWLVGEYNNSYGKKLISKYSLLNNSSVRLFGNVKHENIQHIYQNSDIFAFPSSCENLPNILLEAMASGLPIICSEKGPMPDVLGRAGLFFNPYSPNSISRSFEKLVCNRRLRVKLSLEANKIAKTYSWKKCFEDTIDFCFEVLKK